MKKLFSLLFVFVLGILFAGCGGDDTVKDDLNKNVTLKVNFGTGNADRTMTYNKANPLTLIDGTVLTAGNLKPMWQYIGNELNITFQDVTVQNQKASDLIKVGAAAQFKDATIYGGNSIMEDLIDYGTKGYFVDLTQAMEDGLMPNFQAYLEENPAIANSIKAYDGKIYAIPYIAEIGTYARAFHVRETWVKDLLDAENPTFDTDTVIPVYYQGVYTGNNARTGNNGGTVTPKTGVQITKKTNQNVITLMNAAVGADGKLNGQEAAQVLRKYIEDNYDYDNPSELYLGAKAAYDIDELVALFRVIKTNPVYLTDGKATSVTPYFVRQTSYREDILHFSQYMLGDTVFGSDTYSAKWRFDANGDLVFTHYEESFYNSISAFSQWYAEGLIHTDFHDTADKTNYRTVFYGSDKATNPKYGFMTFDWIASTTADSLNNDVVTILPPVAKINGVWQYYISNSRTIKPDGWAISSAATEEEKLRALTLFDYFFSEEGSRLQNYGLPNLLSEETFVGPDGITYPKYKDWILENAQTLAKGDLSTFLRDWLGCQMPIGYQKEIGFEYQYTSERGFDGWRLLNESTTHFATYAGEGIQGQNSNYYKLVPSFYSFTERQSGDLQEKVTLTEEFYEVVFNVIRYKTLEPNKSDIALPLTYAAYKQLFDDHGAPDYIQIYNNAYDAMTAGN
ncbi:MAG TPA: hypothetical protein VIK96_02475 [Bacilli bacterium]